MNDNLDNFFCFFYYVLNYSKRTNKSTLQLSNFDLQYCIVIHFWFKLKNSQTWFLPVIMFMCKEFGGILTHIEDFLYVIVSFIIVPYFCLHYSCILKCDFILSPIYWKSRMMKIEKISASFEFDCILSFISLGIRFHRFCCRVDPQNATFNKLRNMSLI